MLLAAEKPPGVVPLKLKFLFPFFRAAEGKIGHGIIALESEGIGVDIDGSKGGRAGA